MNFFHIQFTTILFFSIAKISYASKVFETIFGDENYDWRVRPMNTIHNITGHVPVIVKVNLYIRSLLNIDDSNMEFSTQITLRQSWYDSRLAYGKADDNEAEYIILHSGQQIWMPDTFFPNELKAYKHLIQKPNIMIRIYKDGMVFYSSRISLTSSCPMTFERYPMDTQICSIEIASYAQTQDNIYYIWQQPDPVQLNAKVISVMNNFRFLNFTTEEGVKSASTGVYSLLKINLELQRQFGYHLLNAYIPSIMFIFISWLSFWINHRSLSTRILLSVMIIVTLSMMSLYHNSYSPKVEYIKAMDIWFGVNLFFAFIALLESICIAFILRRRKMDEYSLSNRWHFELSKRLNEKWVEKNSKSPNDLRNNNEKLVKDEKEVIDHEIHSADHIIKRIKVIDVVTRIVFPVMFVAFNTLYWIYYL